jgi:hypothetical protein
MFRKLYEIKGPLPNIVLFFKLFYGAHFFFYFQHGQHVEGPPLLSYFQAQDKVTL